ncbi:hypothetical protein [Streptomyces axinellae]|uniref:Uncharacterized protein n=1 Tax=Streptomyces axinellae TaxID=552788 RepID=A0ABP6CU10_9ACTN
MESSDFSEGPDTPTVYWSPDDFYRVAAGEHVPYQPTKEETLRADQHAQLAVMIRGWAWASRTRQEPAGPEVSLVDVARQRVRERIEAGIQVPDVSAAVTEESELLYDMQKCAFEMGTKQRWEERGKFPEFAQRLMDQGHGWNVRQQEEREAQHSPLSASPPADAKSLLPVTDETTRRTADANPRTTRSSSGSFSALRAKWRRSPSPDSHGRSR